MGLDRTYHAHQFIFSLFLLYFLFVLCGRLSWLPASDFHCTLNSTCGIVSFAVSEESVKSSNRSFAQQSPDDAGALQYTIVLSRSTSWSELTGSPYQSHRLEIYGSGPYGPREVVSRTMILNMTLIQNCRGLAVVDYNAEGCNTVHLVDAQARCQGLDDLFHAHHPVGIMNFDKKLDCCRQNVLQRAYLVVKIHIKEKRKWIYIASLLYLTLKALHTYRPIMHKQNVCFMFGKKIETGLFACCHQSIVGNKSASISGTMRDVWTKFRTELKHGLLFDLASDHSCYQQSATVVTLQLLSTVETECDRRNLLLTLCCQLLWYDAKSNRRRTMQLLVAIATFLVSFCDRLQQSPVGLSNARLKRHFTINTHTAFRGE